MLVRDPVCEWKSNQGKCSPNANLMATHSIFACGITSVHSTPTRTNTVMRPLKTRRAFKVAIAFRGSAYLGLQLERQTSQRRSNRLNSSDNTT